MSLLDTILNAQDGGAVEHIGAQLGLGSDQTTAALSALVPALAAGVHRNTQTPDGLAGLITALASGSHQQYVDNPAILGQPSSITDGNAILGHLFGSKDISREVAAHASAQTGIGEDVLKKMLPMVAALVMGVMSRRAASGQSASTPAGPTSAAFGPGAGGELINMITATLGQARSAGGGVDLGGILGRFLGH